MGACLAALTNLGYLTETDWLPVRLELRAPGRCWVDLHPVPFDARGQGRQEDLDGTQFTDPPSAFSIGRLEAAPSGASHRGSSARSTRATSTAARTCTTWPSSTSSSGLWTGTAD